MSDPPDDSNLWIGVNDMTREEARERINTHSKVFAKWMRDRRDIDP